MKYIKKFKIFESNDFSNTKIVNSNGEKMLMFHGGSYCGSGEFKGAIWFTSVKEDARYYAESNHGCLTSAYLNIENPLYSGHIEHLNNGEILDCVVFESNQIEVENVIGVEE